MKKSFKHMMGKKELYIVWDEDKILEGFKAERKKYTEGLFVRYYQKDGPLTKEEYEKNVDDMVDLFSEITAERELIAMIENAKKKKDGSFYKGRVAYCEGSDNTEYITEWHNTWIYNALKTTAIDSNTLLLDYVKVTDTPG